MEIADELVRALEIVRTYGGEEWAHTVDSADQDALVWLLEIVGEHHAYIRAHAFRDVVAAAYRMGWQDGLVEGLARTGRATRRDDVKHS